MDFSGGVDSALDRPIDDISNTNRYHAIEDDDRPNSLADCLNKNGQIDPQKHSLYIQKQEELDELQSQLAVVRAEMQIPDESDAKAQSADPPNADIEPEG